MVRLEQGEQNSLDKICRTLGSGSVEDQEELKGLIFDMGNGNISGFVSIRMEVSKTTV